MNVREGAERFVPTNKSPLVTPYRPIPGRCHPKPGSFLAQQVKPIKNAAGVVVGQSVGRVKKQRHSVCSLRDTGNLHGKKADRFVNAFAHLDAASDAPKVTMAVKSVKGPGYRGRGTGHVRLIDKF